MSNAALGARLEQGLEQIGLSLDEAQRQTLLDYLALLARWNRAYNLTAIDDPAAMVDRHLLDSLSILPWMKAGRVLDAGTGGGLPGVPLAAALPEKHFILVDSSGKKVRFLNQVRRELAMDNIEPVQARIEDLDPAVLDVGDIVARALAPLPRLVGQVAGFLDAGSRLLAMKGRLEAEECAGVPSAYNVERFELDVPGTDAKRSLAIVTRHE